VSNCVVYRHYHVIEGVEVTFYVGIGSPKRPFAFGSRSREWLIYTSQHGDPIVDILHHGLKKLDAIVKEIETIALYKRIIDGGTLVNISIGGSGPCGMIHGEKAREKMSRAGKGKKLSKGQRDKCVAILNKYRGKKHTAESKKKVGEASRGRTHTAESKKKISDASLSFWTPERREEWAERMRGTSYGTMLKGIPKSPEHRAKIGAANKGRTVSEENRAKLRLPRKPLSAEHRAKLSAATKGRPKPEEWRERMREAHRNRPVLSERADS
jgi:NUMOD3 motif